MRQPLLFYGNKALLMGWNWSESEADFVFQFMLPANLVNLYDSASTARRAACSASPAMVYDANAATLLKTSRRLNYSLNCNDDVISCVLTVLTQHCIKY